MPKSKQVRAMVFTINNWTDVEKDNLLTKLPEMCDYWVFSEQVGIKTKTPHLQGYMHFDKKRSLSTLNVWYRENIGKINYFVPAFAKAIQNKKYIDSLKREPEENKAKWKLHEGGCMPKPGTRTDMIALMNEAKKGTNIEDIDEDMLGTYARGHAAYSKMRQATNQKRNRDQLKIEYEKTELRDWQKVIVDDLDKQNDREIIWVYERIGNTGKTWLAKWLCVNRDAFYVQNGKAGDVAHAYNYEEYVVFDLNRRQQMILNYGTMESLKNGMLFSPKYKSKTKTFKSCKIVVFANFLPDFEAWSEDRYDVRDMGQKGQVKIKV